MSDDHAWNIIHGLFKIKEDEMFDADLATRYEMMGQALERALHTCAIQVLMRKEGVYRVYPLGANWPGATVIGKTDTIGTVFSFDPNFIASGG